MSITRSVTPKSIITEAYQVLGIYRLGEEIPSYVLNSGFDLFCDLWLSLNSQTEMVPLYQGLKYTLTPGKASYAWGPDHEIATSVPLGVRNRLTGSYNGSVLLVQSANQTEMGALSSTARGRPTYFLFERLAGYSNISFWPAPDIKCVINLQYLPSFAAPASISSELVLDPSYVQMLVSDLACLLAPRAGLRIPPDVERIAKSMRSAIRLTNVTNQKSDWSPDYSYIDDGLQLYGDYGTSDDDGGNGGGDAVVVASEWTSYPESAAKYRNASSVTVISAPTDPSWSAPGRRVRLSRGSSGVDAPESQKPVYASVESLIDSVLTLTLDEGCVIDPDVGYLISVGIISVANNAMPSQYAKLSNPVFTGIPRSTTPAAPGTDGYYADQIATTDWVISNGGGGGAIAPATSDPEALAATAVVGTSLKYAREDHVHPAESASGFKVTGGELVVSGDSTVTGKLTAGVMKTTTPGIDENSTVVPTTAWVAARTTIPPSDIVPKPDAGTGAIGTSTTYARGDHVHPVPLFPSDATPEALAATAVVGTSLKYAREDHVHPAESASGFKVTGGELVVSGDSTVTGKLTAGNFIANGGTINGNITAATMNTPTPGIDENSTVVPTTKWVVDKYTNAASNTVPTADNRWGSIGTSYIYARSDHAHPWPETYNEISWDAYSYTDSRGKSFVNISVFMAEYMPINMITLFQPEFMQVIQKLSLYPYADITIKFNPV